MSVEEKNQEYDSEPVKYCARCFSLKIKYEESIDAECCGDCGSSDILESSIEEWEKKYERKYGKKFVQKQEDPQKSFIFKMSLDKLKLKVYESNNWREIIKAIYPKFPGGYGKADSIILFFDTLIKQNKLNELKLFLYKHFKY
jgi:hypothetical protein